PRDGRVPVGTARARDRHGGRAASPTRGDHRATRAWRDRRRRHPSCASARSPCGVGALAPGVVAPGPGESSRRTRNAVTPIAIASRNTMTTQTHVVLSRRRLALEREVGAALGGRGSARGAGPL